MCHIFKAKRIRFPCGLLVATRRQQQRLGATREQPLLIHAACKIGCDVVQHHLIRAEMQHQIEKYIGEGRFAMARNLIVTLPPEMHSAWHAAVDIISYAKEDPLKALALDGEGGMLNDATVRKAFK